MNHAVIVATMWDGPKVVGAVDPAAPPSQADLDAIATRLTAENCGVRPTVRVLGEFGIPAYVDTGEAVCEDRYRFLVAFCAVALRGQANLLPPSRTPAAIDDVLAQYPGSYCISDRPLDPSPPVLHVMPADLPQADRGLRGEAQRVGRVCQHRDRGRRNDGAARVCRLPFLGLRERMHVASKLSFDRISP